MVNRKNYHLRRALLLAKADIKFPSTAVKKVFDKKIFLKKHMQVFNSVNNIHV